MTNSIVARDAATGCLGVAVQTCMPSVGSAVPWAEAGVGAVATQAFTDPSYGPRCLDGLRAGQSPELALKAAQQGDPTPMIRQVAVLGADGTAAVTTGPGCVGHAGHLVGPGYSVQANMAASPEVWPAMAAAFENGTEPFAWRLLSALRAADIEGGDARGPMSAAILVVDPAPTDQPAAGTLVDLRVDHSDQPLDDLERALRALDAYEHFHAFVAQLFSGDAPGSLATIQKGLDLLPDEGNFVFGRIGALLTKGDVDAAARDLRALVSTRRSWAVLFGQFVARGLMTLPAGTSIEDILGGTESAPTWTDEHSRADGSPSSNTGHHVATAQRPI